MSVSRRRTAMAIASAGVVAVSLAPLSPLGADPVNDPNESQAGVGPWPDGDVHRYCFAAGFDANLQDNVHWTNEVTDANSDMNRLFEACDLTAAPSTDAVWRDAPLGGDRGLTDCVQAWAVPGRCDRANLILDPVAINANDPYGGGFEHNITKTACHENGHSMGLTHYKSDAFPNPPEGQHDCLISGPVNGDSQWVVYGAHHKGHINANFP